MTLQDKIVTEIANQTQDQIPFLMFRDVTEKQSQLQSQFLLSQKLATMISDC